MKKINFFIKLVKENKLELVEPSEEIMQSYIEKSESSLISAKILFEYNRLEEAVSMAYYSMYHLLIGVLFKIGIKCENHSAAIILMNKLFGLDNSYISSAKKERIDKQYYVDFNVTKKEVKNMIKEVEEFNSNLIDFKAKINNKDIKKYREKFKKLV